MNYNRLIDHTVLKPETQEEAVIKLCKEALEFNFASVCVNPTFVELCAGLLKGSEVKVCTVIGFTLGANTKEVKGFEALDAVNKGAEEIDMVINIGALKDKKYDYVYEEIKYIKECCKGRLLKVIIETCLLTSDEIIKITEICNEVNVDFIKTSTGFSEYGARVEDVELINDHKNEVLEIKASGGIRDIDTAEAMINAGATRLGTSSGDKLMEVECDCCGNHDCDCKDCHCDDECNCEEEK